MAHQEHQERGSFVPGFREDIFLSYAHVDNEDGWIDALHALLDSRLRALLGQNVRTWKDLRLDAGDALWERLEPTIAGSAVFVSILSPSYVQSTACLREARHFCATAKARGGLLVGATCRLVQVVKAPYERGPEIRFLEEVESLQSRFFERHKLNETHFTTFPCRENLPRFADFYATADELAQSLAGILQKMRDKLGAGECTAPRVAVFLAETTSDRKEDRAFVVQEIADRCDLLPAEGLPHTLEELNDRLARELAGCALSVHLLGSRRGLQPEGEEVRTLPEIQLAQAAVIRRLVWIPEALSEVDPLQQRFLEEVGASSDACLEVVRSKRQDFVEHLKDVLADLSRPAPPALHGKAIYVVSDAQDLSRPQLKALRNCILSQGLRVELPVFEGDVEELRRAEEQALRDTNATLIYYGNARDIWVRTRRMEILKALATLEHGSTYRRALYLCSPETPIKRAAYMDLPGSQLPEAMGPALLVLGDCGEFLDAKLEPLLRSLARDAS